jgi:hypothetical protein
MNCSIRPGHDKKKSTGKKSNKDGKTAQKMGFFFCIRDAIITGDARKKKPKCFCEEKAQK